MEALRRPPFDTLPGVSTQVVTEVLVEARENGHEQPTLGCGIIQRTVNGGQNHTMLGEDGDGVQGDPSIASPSVGRMDGNHVEDIFSRLRKKGVSVKLPCKLSPQLDDI